MPHPGLPKRAVSSAVAHAPAVGSGAVPSSRSPVGRITTRHTVTNPSRKPPHPPASRRRDAAPIPVYTWAFRPSLDLFRAGPSAAASLLVLESLRLALEDPGGLARGTRQLGQLPDAEKDDENKKDQDDFTQAEHRSSSLQGADGRRTGDAPVSTLPWKSLPACDRSTSPPPGSAGRTPSATGDTEDTTRSPAARKGVSRTHGSRGSRRLQDREGWRQAAPMAVRPPDGEGCRQPREREQCSDDVPAGAAPGDAERDE